MGVLEDISGQVVALGVFAELDVPATELPESAVRLSDGSVRDALGIVAGLEKQVAMLRTVLVGVVAARSGRDRGHGGLVQGTGHRNAVEFVRDVTGVTRGEAIRAVKVGEALLDGHCDKDGHAVAPVVGVDSATGAADGTDAGADGTDSAAATTALPWHEPLRVALLSGQITTAQSHAIKAGLGEPPIRDLHSTMANADGPSTLHGQEPSTDQPTPETVIEAWRGAARELAAEAPLCTVEDLASRARVLRDLLDPAGAEQRYAARFQKRSLRWSTTSDGLPAAHIVFDDEGGTWFRNLMDTALSPRRGGPRFVAAGEKKQAEDLVNDSRSNDQLAYDLFFDVLRAGALADVKDVYGTKEAGVRLVTLTDTVTGDRVHRDAFGRLLTTAQSDDSTLTIPGSVLERALCVTGMVEVTVDTHGTPLDLGREARLYSPKQKLVMAIRDGGCLWPGCDRPPAYCEAHHSEHWADGGATDCASGVLLCRYHHLHLHNTGWRIEPVAGGGFLLHAPPGMNLHPIPLRSKSSLRWLWDPPPDRPPWRTAA
ncbi:DUF222 domain-containing protein [Microbacterium sp.]|uniref:HNH endonuclease signature motif containing protein n=1 Tax=Microbacterium sp. TaxID=51671 RepID=UPI0039E21B36